MRAISSPEALRVASSEFLYYGQSSPIDRFVRFLARNEPGDEIDDFDQPSAWEVMLGSMPA